MLKPSTVAAAAALLALSGLAASAGVNKTWVSGTGVDSGTCTYASPCATFNYAIGQTNVNGEVDVKDSGGYGTILIQKSISIIAPDGVLATINVPRVAAGVVISGQGGNYILLKGLVIDGHNAGNTSGIVISVADHVTIDNCTIVNNSNGIDSIGGTSTHDYITNNLIYGNETGIASITGDIMVIGANKITSNGLGLRGSIYYSYGDNKINGNTTDVDPNAVVYNTGAVMR